MPAASKPTDFVRVDNNCSHFVILPPLGAFENGHRLVPGANNVPKAYVRALESFMVPLRNADGTMGQQTLFESLGEPGPTSNGRAQVVVIGDTTEHAPEGPPPPQDLSTYSEEIALKLVEVTTDRDALKRWGKDRRSSVSNAAKAKVV